MSTGRPARVSNAVSQAEPVRLVIWDLDETFWRGTLTEGGISEYIHAHHDIVIELSRRGIVNSICSKNDHAAVERVLRDQGLWEYFVLPSINWTAKGPRLRALVDAIGLRPATVLFIDDNPGNRAAAAACVPGIQSRDETKIAGLLRDPLLSGKADAGLTRLKQYKLLEQRQRDAEIYSGDNEEFLRGSDIRVYFDYDVEKNIGRAVELINRTNQLNFTKQRLPEDETMAIAELRQALSLFCSQAALIRVTDRYGDYGYCGFFYRWNGQDNQPGALVHFCFSCRTLGMQVEKFVYQQLGRPEIYITGEVATDLLTPRPIDWIRFGGTAETQVFQATIPQVRLRGGCELDAVSHYFVGHAAKIFRETNVQNGLFFTRKDVSAQLRLPGDPPLEPEFLVLAELCGHTRDNFESTVFASCPPGTVLVYSPGADTYPAYRHKATGRRLTVNVIPNFYGNVCDLSSDEINTLLDEQNLTDEDRRSACAAAFAIKESTAFVSPLSEDEMKTEFYRIFAKAPAGCRMVAIGLDEFWKDEGGTSQPRNIAIVYNQWLRAVASAFGIPVFAFHEYIKSEEERGWNEHLDRIVYYRLASAIIEWATQS